MCLVNAKARAKKKKSAWRIKYTGKKHRSVQLDDDDDDDDCDRFVNVVEEKNASCNWLGASGVRSAFVARETDLKEKSQNLIVRVHTN